MYSRTDGRVPLFACVFGVRDQRANNEQTTSEHPTNRPEQRADNERAP